MKTLMQVYGAAVVVVPTSLDRWKLQRVCVQELGWMPISGFISPPIGSNCYAIDGYKSMAFEVYRQLKNTVPDVVIFPASYSDGQYGFYKGMRDLQDLELITRLPKMVAAEVFGSMEQTLASHADRPVAVNTSWSVSFSTASSLCSWQGLESVVSTSGYARCSTDAETVKMQSLLARTEGLYAENASVTALVVAGKLAAEGKIGPDDKVVAILTSTGLKDPATTQRNMPSVPHIDPNMNELRRALDNSYGIKL
jgi:threonine synthase